MMIPRAVVASHIKTILLVAALLCLAALAACAKASPTPTATPLPPTPAPAITPTAGPTVTPYPTDTPTPQPLGSQSNPLVFGLVLPAGQTALPPEAGQLAASLSKATGYTIQAQLIASYRSLLVNLHDGRVHLAFLPPFTYLEAQSQGSGTVLLVANHFGVYAYGTEFLANVYDGYTPYFDPASGKDLGNASQALAQFSGKRPCLVDPASGAGYLLPIGILNQAGIATSDPVIARSYTAVVRALYTRHICDFGAVYAITGDPRTASGVQEDMPDAVQKVPVIWRSDAVIPSLNVTASAQLSLDMTQAISRALRDLVATSDGKTLLSAAAGGYTIDDFKTVDDSFYAPLQTYVTASGLPLDNFIGN